MRDSAVADSEAMAVVSPAVVERRQASAGQDQASLDLAGS
jgi:hypothetical protein